MEDVAQYVLGTLPQYRFTISKRGPRILTKEIRGFSKQRWLQKAITDTFILPHHHDFEKSFDEVSADLTDVA